MLSTNINIKEEDTSIPVVPEGQTTPGPTLPTVSTGAAISVDMATPAGHAPLL